MTSDTMLPMLRQMLDADGDAVRAGILLSAPTRILLRWRVEFDKGCRKARFEEGEDYLALLDAAASATRIDGLLPPPLQLSLETARQRLVVVAEGEQSAVGGRQSEGPPAPSRPAGAPPSRVPAASGSVPAFSPDDRATGAIDGSGSKPPAGVEDGRQAGARLPTADCRLPGNDTSRLAAPAPQDEGGAS